jgi:superfamily II DNA or RNA helicase
MTALPDIASSNRMEDARRTLMDTIRQLALASHFSRATLKQAEALALRGKDWRKPLAWFQPDGSPQTQALQCELIDADGAGPCVTTYLYPLFGQVVLETRCTCGHARCVHAAALLVRLQQLLDWPRAMTPLQRWQQGLESLREPPPRRGPARREPATWPLRCLLRLDDARSPATPWVRLVVVAPDAGDGSPCELPPDHPRAQPHLSRQAMTWLAQLNLTQKRRRGNDAGYELHGDSGARLLDECLRAGIVQHAPAMQALRGGADRDPPWQWSHGDDGQARIALRWPATQEVRLFELDGLRYLDLASGETGALRLARAVWDSLRHMPPVPPAEAVALAAGWPPHPLLAGLPPPPPPPPMRQVAVPLRPVLMLGAARHTQRGDHVFHLHAFADYAGHRLPLADDAFRQHAVRRGTDGFVVIHRDIDGETRAWRALDEAGLTDLAALLTDVHRLLAPVPAPGALAHRTHWQGGGETFAALETALQALAGAGFALEYDPELPFTLLPPETKLKATLDAGERPGFTQFELAAVVDGEEIDVLPIVLGGMARHAFPLTPAPGEPRDAHWLAPIGTNRWLPLPLAHLREWMVPLVECLDRPLDGRTRRLALTRSQTLALSDNLRRHGIDIEGTHAAEAAATLAALRDAAVSASTIDPPPGFHGTLRRYQREGLQWLQALRQSRLGGVLADDMGLGKTVQVIAHLLVEQDAGRLDRPALVVAPTSLVFNWFDEVARFAPTLDCLNYTGPNRASLRGRLAGAHVIVTSYALLANDMATLEAIDYALLVLDEAQWIKNPLTQTSRAVRRLRAAHRLAVTGTPLENHLGELWAHFDAVLPGYLGDYRSFNRSFRQPIEQREDDARRAILRQRIAPFLLRRSKASVAPELPPKTETLLRVSMDEAQRRLYESLRLAQSARVREALASYGHEQSRIVVLSALLRLRQVCCDPRLIDGLRDPPPSAKLEALLELVQSLREDDRQVLVFSQFTSMLALIGQALDEAKLEYALLTGDTADRAAPVRRFQAGDAPILLASLKAGGVGLNLTAADAVVHYDPWWNPAVETQAVDRAHRLGREQPVFVYKLLCDDTIEERIEAMKDQKSGLADAMLDAGAAPLARLDERDLRHLFDLSLPSP